MMAGATPNGFSNAGDFGGGDVDVVIWPELAAQKRAFAIASGQPFSSDLNEIAFLIRADGKFQNFRFEGHENIKVDKRDKAVSVDIGVPVDRWRGKTRREIAEYLVGAMRNSISDVLAEASKRGLQADSTLVMEVFERSMELYMDDVAKQPFIEYFDDPPPGFVDPDIQRILDEHNKQVRTKLRI
jgi:hypothetical protein